MSLDRLTNESSWSLFCDFDAKRSRRVRLVGVALDGDVAVRKERPVDAAVVLISEIQIKYLVNKVTNRILELKPILYD
jgi:hypothetical protein